MRLLLFFVCISFFTFGQKEIKLSSSIDKVTIFFQGAQVQHQKKTELNPGRQILVFEKLTDYMDPNSVQLKATGDLTILSVSTRKNYEDLKMSITEIEELNKRKNMLYDKDQLLRDEYAILQNDKSLLQLNSDLKGSEVGMKVSELKEAYTFIHTKMLEIVGRQTVLIKELEMLQKEINKVEQEIQTRQSKPVINFTEILVEVDVANATNSTFDFNYISPRASWTPYYDLRIDGIGKPVRLEAKALVNQSTGIEWKEVDLVLSTNDPYENSKEPILQEWYLNYNNYPQPKNVTGRNIPTFNYSGQKLRGEVIDASTGEPLAFAKVTFSNNPSVGAVTDFDGKFEVIVPKGESYLTASYIGYNSMQLQITAPYLKFFVQPQEVSLEEVVISSNKESSRMIKQEMRKNVAQIESVQLTKRKKLNFLGNKERSESDGWEYRGDMAGETEKLQEAKNVQTVISKKELRVEYAIQTKMTIPSDGQDQRVQISTYELPANYEYHAAPKLDPSVYLVAQVSGWEKLNLLNGESNLYFDGTYIGKTYIDVNSTKDTLSFSLGKDNKIQMERTKVKENSKTKTIGTRQKVDVAWEIKLKNNGGANIPIFIKDQFPISIVEDIKVKRGEFSEGRIADKSGIITWNFMLDASQNKILKFDYSVDYQKGYVLYIE
jgi:ribosomal protein L21